MWSPCTIQICILLYKNVTRFLFSFKQSVILSEYIRIEPRLNVCVSACVCELYSTSGWADFFSDNHQKHRLRCFPVPFFSVFENSNLMTSLRPFCAKPLRHSYVIDTNPITRYHNFWICCSLNLYFVCYFISAKLVNNFYLKWRTAFWVWIQNGTWNQN